MWSGLASRFENPVLTKEMRTRMRGTRAYWVMLAYVAILSLVLLFAYAAWYQEYAHNSYRPIPGGEALGRRLFVWLFATQAGMIALITPALTAGMLTLEREQRTFELLMLTILRPRQVVLGKLASAFGFAVLLLTVSLPLAGISLMLGGVAPQEILVVYLVMGMSSLFYGALGMLFSSMLQSTALATAGTYLSALLITIVTLMAGADGGGQVLFASVNPIMAIWNSLDPAPFYGWKVPTWIMSLAVNGLAALLATAGAIHRLEEGVTENPGLLRWLSYLLFTLLFVGLVGNVLGAGTTLYAAGSGSGSPTELRIFLTILAGVLMAALSVLALVFCTGNIMEAAGVQRPGPARPTRGILNRIVRTPLFAGGYAWGPAYLVLLFITGALAIAFGLTSARSPVWILGLGTGVASLIVALAVAMGAIALARFFSALLGARPAAAAVAFATLTALVLVPLLSYIGWDSSLHPGHSLFFETLYLNPVIALMALVIEPGSWHHSVPAVWAGQDLAWVVTIFLYLGLAAVLEIAGQAVLSRQRRGAVRRKA